MRSRNFRGLGRTRRISSTAAMIVVALLIAPGTALASSHSSFHPTIDIPQLLGVVLFIVGIVSLIQLVRYAHSSTSQEKGWLLGVIVVLGLVLGLVLMHAFGLPSFSLRKP